MVEDHGVPERCKVCGQFSGMRPDTCFGDGEHDFEPIPESEWTKWQHEYFARLSRIASIFK